jgi:hypothetical protein
MSKAKQSEEFKHRVIKWMTKNLKMGAYVACPLPFFGGVTFV